MDVNVPQWILLDTRWQLCTLGKLVVRTGPDLFESDWPTGPTLVSSLQWVFWCLFLKQCLLCNGLVCVWWVNNFSKARLLLVLSSPFQWQCDLTCVVSRFEVMYLKDVGDMCGLKVSAWPGAPPSHPLDIVVVVRQRMSSRQFHQVALLVPGYVFSKMKWWWKM